LIRGHPVLFGDLSRNIVIPDSITMKHKAPIIDISAA